MNFRQFFTKVVIFEEISCRESCPNFGLFPQDGHFPYFACLLSKNTRKIYLVLKFQMLYLLGNFLPTLSFRHENGTIFLRNEVLKKIIAFASFFYIYGSY